MAVRKTARNRKSVPYPVAKKHHLDRRADRIIAAAIEAEDDELLTTAQVANWFGVSPEWLEIGRSKKYGPEFVRLGQRVVRYRRSACRKYLQSRTYASTAEYGDREHAGA